MLSRILLVGLTLLFLGANNSTVDAWEIKKADGNPYEPSRFAISLEEHNHAFSTSAYCMDKNKGLPNMLNRNLCEECSEEECEWKLREGFTTEEEWQEAVTQEMTRLHEGSTSPDQVGTWIVEAPRSLALSVDIIAEFENYLGGMIALDKIVKSGAESRARYFVVSGNHDEVCSAMLELGFTTCTPIPPALRVHPSLVEGATDESLGDSDNQDIRVNLIDISNSPNNDKTRANMLATAWSAGLVATVVGHTNARILAENEVTVTIQSLKKSEAAVVAMTIAEQGGVAEWIAPMAHAQLTAANTPEALPLDNVGGGWGKISKMPSRHHALWDMGIHGENQVVGVADSGLDWNHCFFSDSNEEAVSSLSSAPPPLQSHLEVWDSTTHRKIRQFTTWKKGDSVDQSGHGTHVCGILAGRPEGGLTSDQQEEAVGVAYEAKISFLDGLTEGYGGLHFPFPYSTFVFGPVYEIGVRIHSNSWSFPTYPEYGKIVRDIDGYTWENQDFIVLAAAGNRGGRSTVVTPAIAKNVVAVGSAAPSSSNWVTWSTLASSSSRGPTPDGRIKPDVCGYGVRIESAKAQTQCGTKTTSGTSMATPMVAGVAALVRQYFVEGYYPDGIKDTAAGKKDQTGFTPMGALLKAVLVNSGEKLGGSEAKRQGGVFPSMDQGFGVVAIDETLITPRSRGGKRKLFVDGSWTTNCAACPKIQNGETYGYHLKIIDNNFKPAQRPLPPLKVTLVWSDYPGLDALVSQDPTINDIDLTVVEVGTDGESIIHYANGGSGTDQKNNVEHIEISSPKPQATYIVNIKGADVTMGPQPYAVVINGPFSSESSSLVPKSGSGGGMPDSAHGLFGGGLTSVIGASAALVSMVVVLGSVAVYRRRRGAGGDEENTRDLVQEGTREENVNWAITINPMIGNIQEQVAAEERQ